MSTMGEPEEGSKNLLTLPDDVLLTLFKYLTDKELGVLCKTSKFLCEFIGVYILNKRINGSPMVGVRNPEAIIHQRISKTYTPYELCCIEKNWLSGSFIESGYAYRRLAFTDCKLHLERNWLYVSNGRVLEKYGRLNPVKRFPKIRTENDALQRKRTFEIEFPDDIVDYIKRDETVFLARSYGKYTVFENEINTELKLHGAKERMNCCDFRKDIFATSSDLMVKIWRRHNELGLMDLELMHTFNEKSYRVMTLNDNGSILYGGNFKSAGLSEINIETGKMHMLSNDISDIMGIKIKDEHLLLMVNRSSNLLMYDRRTRTVESTSSSTGNHFICMDYDGCNGIVCGSLTNGVIALFDCRKWNTALQTYTVNCVTQKGATNVLSVVCDNRYCFAAVRNHVHVFDFKIEN